jgi:hypothetical protein
MASVASMVRSYVDSLGRDVIFATKQLLHCGGRNAIDHALSRLVGQKHVTRLAAGVFVVLSSAEVPSASEIAHKKADAFNKRIFESKVADIVQWTFLTNGCRSSFRSIHGRVFFKTASPRRFCRQESAVSPGQHLRLIGSTSSAERRPEHHSRRPAVQATPSCKTYKIALSLDVYSSGRSRLVQSSESIHRPKPVKRTMLRNRGLAYFRPASSPSDPMNRTNCLRS